MVSDISVSVFIIVLLDDRLHNWSNSEKASDSINLKG
jgi:hypothetical protein